MASADKTGPIQLPTERHPTLIREPGAPEPLGIPKRRPSEMIENICREAMEIGRSKDPSETQIAKMSADISSLQNWAKMGLELAQGAGGGNGGGRGSGPLTVVMSVVLAGAMAIGLPSLTSSGDAAKAKVLAETIRSEQNVDRARIKALEDNQVTREQRQRRGLAITVRWLGDEQRKQCLRNAEIAKGLNWIGKRQSKNSDIWTPISIDCNELPLVPPELEELWAQGGKFMGNGAD